MTELPIIESCRGCGVCCMHMAVPPYDLVEIALLQQEWPNVAIDYELAMAFRKTQLAVQGTDEIPCAFLDPLSRNCKHHEQRPEICRDFELGGKSCRQYRTDADL